MNVLFYFIEHLFYFIVHETTPIDKTVFMLRRDKLH